MVISVIYCKMLFLWINHGWLWMCQISDCDLNCFFIFIFKDFLGFLRKGFCVMDIEGVLVLVVDQSNTSHFGIAIDHTCAAVDVVAFLLLLLWCTVLCCCWWCYMVEINLDGPDMQAQFLCNMHGLMFTFDTKLWTLWTFYWRGFKWLLCL